MCRQRGDCAGRGKNLPGSTVFALELYDDALYYLRENTKDCPNIRVLRADVLGDLAALNLPPLDMILSNPPYLTTQELAELPEQVTHEPKMALDGGEDGLTFYNSIAESALALLGAEGLLLFEVGWQQAQQVAQIMSRLGYRSIGVTKDLGGIDRCVYGRRPL